MIGSGFLLADGALIATQAALVALPGRGVPPPLERLRAGHRPLGTLACIAALVVASTLGPSVATGLSRLAFIAVPLLAAAALAWAARGSRPALAILAAPLLAIAWTGAGSLVGDIAAAALSALSCVALGRLLAGVMPGLWLKCGLVVWAVYDAVAVFGSPLHSPDAIVDAALPGPGLPQLQVLDLHAASLGYADVFVAALLGGVLAAERTRQWTVALIVLCLSAGFDVLFVAFRTLPATVPVAVALLIAEAVRRLRSRTQAALRAESGRSSPSTRPASPRPRPPRPQARCRGPARAS
jgi:hypothetical protein